MFWPISIDGSNTTKPELTSLLAIIKAVNIVLVQIFIVTQTLLKKSPFKNTHQCFVQPVGIQTILLPLLPLWTHLALSWTHNWEMESYTFYQLKVGPWDVSHLYPLYGSFDLGQELVIDNNDQDLKALPMVLHKNFTAFLVKPLLWSMEDWKKEWTKNLVYLV